MMSCQQQKLPKRLTSLDVFRGITITGMILVNMAGVADQVYPPLLHADWNGCTPTD
jgi:predicted acyltransferase